MNKIKELRTQLRLTQKDIATMMHTTQQTIGRWENGTSEPSLSNLRDLAYALGTTTSVLIGESHASRQNSLYNLIFSQEKLDLEGFWGNVGILPANRTKSIWYPITLETVNRILERSEEGIPFMFETLNNKLVFINPKHVKRIVSLDDDGDAFPNDWELSWHESGCESPAIFDALEIYLQETYWDEEADPDNTLSDHLRAVVEKLIEEHNLDEEAIIQLISGMRVIYADGSMESFTLQEFGSIVSLFFEFDTGVIPSTMTIDNEEYTLSLPVEGFSIVEFPRKKVMEAMDAMHEEMEMWEMKDTKTKDDTEPTDLKDSKAEEAVSEDE